jgi:cell division protein FtsL
MAYEGTSALVLDPPIAKPQRRPAPYPAPRAVPEWPEIGPSKQEPAASLDAENKPVSFGAIALFMAAMTVLMFIVHSYMELNQLSTEGRNAVAELSALKREERTLSRHAEASISLSEVEAYAIGELGMVKPESGQIVYISIASHDHAEIVPQKGFWGSVRELFSSITGEVVGFFD